ncbi:hypothetical protein GCM10023075_61270 [Streptosporangium album]
MGEVDHHLGARQALDRVARVDGRDQLQVVRRLDGLAHFHTDTPSGAQNSNPDHGPRLYRHTARKLASHQDHGRIGNVGHPDHGHPA